MIKGEIKSLTGIRGVAALAVLYHHFGEKMEAITPSLNYISIVRDHGNLGVELFFILSGFIMTYVYSQHKKVFGGMDYRNFLVKRVARIYPSHITVLVLLFLIWWTAKTVGIKMDGEYSIVNFVLQVFMLNGYYPKEFSDWNYPNWSVSIEWFGYFAVFPLSILVSRIGWFRRNPAISCFVILAIPIFVEPLIHPWFRTIVLITSTFLSGVFLFIAWEKRTNFRFGRISVSDAATLLVIAILVSAAVFPFSANLVRSLILISFPFLLFGLATSQGIVARMLSRKTVVYIGTVSYALYISHALVEKVLKVIAPVGKCALMPAPLRFLIVTGHILLPILLAICLYHIVEEPARKWFCRVFLKKKEKPPVEVELRAA